MVGSTYIVSAPLEMSNITEVKQNISGETGKTFLPTYFLNYYDSLRNFSIENLALRFPLAPYGRSEKMRLDYFILSIFVNIFGIWQLIT